MPTETDEKVYEKQEAHTEEDCKINEAPHNHPDMDCGHFVGGDGPGNQNSAGNEATGPGIGL